jgi:hypothetical protein
MQREGQGTRHAFGGIHDAVSEDLDPSPTGTVRQRSLFAPKTQVRRQNDRRQNDRVHTNTVPYS